MSAHATSIVNSALLAVVVWAVIRAHAEPPRRLYLQVRGRWISGICAAIARALGLPVVAVRLAAFGALVLGAHAILAYMVLELVMRWDPSQRHLLWSTRLWNRISR